MSNNGQPAQHGPYAPKVASVGGRPTVSTDVPITAVFMFLFIIGAAANMTILQTNRRKGHKFLMSGLMFGFCMARITTMVMRIVWACYPHNVRVGIAAGIFVSAGVLLLFVINLIFAQRIVRAAHPHFGWHKAFSRAFLCLYILVAIMLAVVITATVQSFYTLNGNTHRIDLDLQRTASTYLMFISFLPIPMVVLGILIPRKQQLEKFGSGRWRSKVTILLTTTTLLCLGAAFRCGTSWKNARPINSPAWYHAKWCFYFFNFTIEIVVIYLYILVRVDRRFHIPNGSKGPGDYTQEPKSTEDEPRPISADSQMGILTEEEVFDNQSPISVVGKDAEIGRPSSDDYVIRHDGFVSHYQTAL